MRQKSQKVVLKYTLSRYKAYPKKRYGPIAFDVVMLAKPGRIDRFLRKILRSGPDQCHEWQGGRTKEGYGLFQGSDNYRGYSLLAHRVAFWLAHGREPEGLVLHSCDNPPCCNPAHLRDGTHKDNSQDAIDRGRFKPATYGNGRPRHPREQEAVMMRYTDRCQINDIAARIGVCRTTIIRWCQEHEERLLNLSIPTGNHPHANPPK